MSASFRLLAATDFSETARRAVERAARLASNHPGAHLTLAHVVSHSMVERLRSLLEDEAPTVHAQWLDEAHKALDVLASHVGRLESGAVETVMLEGAAAKQLPALAEETRADLIVMGAQGMRRIEDFLVGSTTERVLRTTRRPVLAVRERPRDSYTRVLVPTDFSDHAAKAARWVHDWLPRAEIVLLHAFGVELESTLRFASVDEAHIHAYRIRAREAALERMETFVAEIGVPTSQVSRVLVHGAPGSQILEHARTLRTDLIALGKHGQSALDELLLGSVAEYVLTRAAGDVLVVGATT